MGEPAMRSGAELLSAREALLSPTERVRERSQRSAESGSLIASRSLFSTVAHIIGVSGLQICRRHASAPRSRPWAAGGVGPRARRPPRHWSQTWTACRGCEPAGGVRAAVAPAPGRRGDARRARARAGRSAQEAAREVDGAAARLARATAARLDGVAEQIGAAVRAELAVGAAAPGAALARVEARLAVRAGVPGGLVREPVCPLRAERPPAAAAACVSGCLAARALCRCRRIGGPRLVPLRPRAARRAAASPRCLHAWSAVWARAARLPLPLACRYAPDLGRESDEAECVGGWAGAGGRPGQPRGGAGRGPAAAGARRDRRPGGCGGLAARARPARPRCASAGPPRRPGAAARRVYRPPAAAWRGREAGLIGVGPHAVAVRVRGCRGIAAAPHRPQPRSMQAAGAAAAAAYTGGGAPGAIARAVAAQWRLRLRPHRRLRSSAFMLWRASE